MYPTRELTDLARRKATLRAAIAQRRRECVVAVREVAKPLEWLDRAQLLWRRVAPLLAILLPLTGPSGAARKFPFLKIISTAARWAPSLFRVFKPFRAARTSTVKDEAA
jgi:hypothetical protein